MRRLALACALMVFMIAGSLGAEVPGVRIGLLAPITGPTPDWGAKQVVGMNLALDAVNRRGGIHGKPVEAVVCDTGGDPVRVREEYQRLCEEDRVLAVIGPLYSDMFKAIMEDTNTFRVPIIATASATPGLSDLQKRPYAFRMTVSSEKKEQSLAKAWIEKHGIRSVAVLYDRRTMVNRTVAERLWPRILGDLGVEIANRNEPLAFEIGERAFDDLAARAAAFPADGLCIAAMPHEAGHLIRTIRAKGLSLPILGASPTANPKVVEIAGKAAEGLWSQCLFYPEDPNPKVQKYVCAFKERCGALYPDMNCQPEQYDVAVHDILLFLADILKKEGDRSGPFPASGGPGPGPGRPGPHGGLAGYGRNDGL